MSDSGTDDKRFFDSEFSEWECHIAIDIRRNIKK
jgi:hypothetical protein